MKLTQLGLAVVITIGVALAGTAAVVGAQDVTTDSGADMPAWADHMDGEVPEWMAAHMSGDHTHGEHHSEDHVHGEHHGEDHVHGEHADHHDRDGNSTHHSDGHC